MSYGLYIAKIVGVCSSTDNRLQIRILPQMSTLDENLCPKWPSFFKDELYTGLKGDLVWCICDDEFNNGYVLGLANYNTYGDDEYSQITSENKTINLSIPKEELQDKIQDYSVKLLAQKLDFTDIKVTYWGDSSIHFIERSTGGFIIAFSSGSMLIMRNSEFIVHMGNENGSTFKMDLSGISMSSKDSVKIQAPYIGLGENPTGNVLVTNGESSEGGYVSNYVEA